MNKKSLVLIEKNMVGMLGKAEFMESSSDLCQTFLHRNLNCKKWVENPVFAVLH